MITTQRTHFGFPNRITWHRDKRCVVWGSNVGPKGRYILLKFINGFWEEVGSVRGLSAGMLWLMGIGGDGRPVRLPSDEEVPS